MRPCVLDWLEIPCLISRRQANGKYSHFSIITRTVHSVCLTMKVRIIEKIYHHTNSHILSTPYRTDRQLFWVKELGTAMPYGCNDSIKGVDAAKST